MSGALLKDFMLFLNSATLTEFVVKVKIPHKNFAQKKRDKTRQVTEKFIGVVAAKYSYCLVVPKENPLFN